MSLSFSFLILFLRYERSDVILLGWAAVALSLFISYYRFPNSYGESGPISSSSFLACDRWKKSGRMRILRREGERERRGDDVPDARGV